MYSWGMLSINNLYFELKENIGINILIYFEKPIKAYSEWLIELYVKHILYTLDTEHLLYGGLG